MTAMLEMRAVKSFYGQSEVLHGIDLAVEEAGMTVLLGANGAGKTTTLRAICGMVRSEGEILFGGRRIERCTTEQIAGFGVAHVPEGRGTFTGLTVEENLRSGGYAAAGRPGEAVPLSGGERAMLAIARPLMVSPGLLGLDEPSFGLAPRVVEAIFGIV